MAIAPVADHAGIAECVGADLPTSEFTRDTSDPPEEEAITWEDRRDYLAMLSGDEAGDDDRYEESELSEMRIRPGVIDHDA